MPKHTFTVYADINCPFCFMLHERLLELGHMEQVDWRCVEHDPSAKYDTNDLHIHAELTNEVNHVRAVAPEANIIIPPSRPNSHLAIELTTQAMLLDVEKGIRFRSKIYRALWQDGFDIGDANLIEQFRIESGLPEIVVTQQVRDAITDWYKEWNEGEFSRNIPSIVTDNGNKILGLPSVDVIEASLSEESSNFEEGAFCYLKPKEKILVASNNDETLTHLMSVLDSEFQIEIAQSGNMVFESCIGSSSPDLVIMDINLDEVNGYETCLKLKDTSESQNISIILLANERNVDFEVKAFDSGANDFIVTPCAHEVLKARIRVLLRLKRTTDLLEQFSRLDSLTEIPNRREFDRILEKEWLRAKRTQKPLSLILLDVDYFKKYNDNYGHLEGDHCLKEVAQVVEKNIRRAQDTVARYGGEEFVVILPDTDKNGAIRVAEQIAKGLETRNLPHKFSEVSDRITASQGISTVIPNSPITPRNLIDAADVALYSAKKQGRNRFMVNLLES